MFAIFVFSVSDYDKQKHASLSSYLYFVHIVELQSITCIQTYLTDHHTILCWKAGFYWIILCFLFSCDWTAFVQMTGRIATVHLKL